ncbi:MAG: DNAase [Gallionellales bacterium GWA2_60_18]|nr:MAG: DNAase [Gallionellales bacterium GWA2_60_18]
MLIDTHCHLDAAEFGSAQADIVRAAAAAGVDRIVVPAVNRNNFEAVRKLCALHPGCAPAYGIHPMFVDSAMPDDLTVLRNYLRDHRPVAIGEIGMDFFIANYAQARQEHFFVEQLKLAREFDLPVLLHIRRAQDIILKHLRLHRVRGGIAHAFNGSRRQAEEFIKLGFKLGFGGAMTWPRATHLRDLAATLPLETIVLETDAPDLPPAFLPRGAPNKPEYLPRIAQTLAELRGVPPQEIARITTQNASSVLPRLFAPD